MEKVETLDEIKEAAGRIKELGAGYVVIKSGSRNDSREAVDVLYDGREFTIASAPKIEPAIIMELAVLIRQRLQRDWPMD